MKSKSFIIALAVMLAASCNVSADNSKKTKDKADTTVAVATELTVQDFKTKIMDYEENPQTWVFAGKRPAVIDFYATWCGPCKAVAPNIEKLARNYKGKVDVYKVNIDKQKELAMLFGITSIPAILFIPMEGKPLMQVGAMTYEGLTEAVSHIMEQEEHTEAK